VLDEAGTSNGTAKEIVAEMHSTSFAPADSDAAWMRDVSDRAFTQTNHDIDTSSAETFLEGMLEAGLLKPAKA
jgi:hypothetical protein